MSGRRRSSQPGAARGKIGQPIIDPVAMQSFAPKLAQAALELEAMRLLSVVPSFSHTWSGSEYTVKLLDVTITDRHLGRAILLAAKEAGVESAQPQGDKTP